MNKLSIQSQWDRLINTMSKRVIGADSRHFTQDLYETLHTRCNMIAHFNREGFIKARLWTLSDFDQTIESMKSSKLGRELLKNTDLDKLAMARYRIASAQRGHLLKQAEIYKYHAEKLQNQFSKPL